MKAKDIAGEAARVIARHLQTMYLSEETRQLLKQKSEERNMHVNALFAEAFLSVLKEKKEINDAVLKEYLLNLP